MQQQVAMLLFTRDGFCFQVFDHSPWSQKPPPFLHYTVGGSKEAAVLAEPQAAVTLTKSNAGAMYMHLYLCV